MPPYIFIKEKKMGIYQTCFELIKTYIFGGVELTADMNLIATLISSISVIVLFSLPFVLVFWLIKTVVGGWR